MSSNPLLLLDNNTMMTVVNHGTFKRDFQYKRIRDMHLGQEGIVFKLYVTPSETQPIIRTDKGNEAKKIQNVYVYCQLISRVE